MKGRVKKKTIFGRRIGIGSAYRRYKKLVINKLPKNIYEGYETNMPLFCPWCGCEKFGGASGNMAAYPELLENVYCARCGEVVMMADNSPYIHILAWISHDEINSRSEFEEAIKGWL